MKNKLMNFLIAVVLLFSCSGDLVYSQTKPDGSSPQFLFPEFVRGEVRMKNGKSQFALLNYNTVSEKMVYMQDEKIYDIIETDRIDTVYILRSRFIPSGTIFYEVAVKDTITLFIQHKGDLIPPGKPAAYGGTSQVSSSTYMSSVQLSSGHYNLKLPEDYDVQLQPVFRIKYKGSFSVFNNEKQFIKIFPDQADELKRYIRQSKIKFDSIQDVVDLVVFCNRQVLAR